MPSAAAQAFMDAHWPDPAHRPFTDEDRARLSARLPAPMLDLLEANGWCSYDGQVIWLCDPDEWMPIGRAWLPDRSRVTEVVVRSAFGDMIVWDGEKFWLVLANELTRITQTSDPDFLFGRNFLDPEFHFGDELARETAEARAELGDLEWTQMFNFAPALALGGTRSDAQLAREDARVALDILHQLGPIQSIEI
jgi:hypothetical protein